MRPVTIRNFGVILFVEGSLIPEHIEINETPIACLFKKRKYNGEPEIHEEDYRFDG